MNNWIPKNKTVRFSFIIASFSVVLYFVGLFMVSNEIKKVENFYTSAESESSKEERFWAIKSAAEANKAPIQTLRDFLVKKGDEIGFIKKIEEVARKSSIKFEIDSIDVKTTEGDLFKEDVNVKMKIEGSWKNIYYFIDELNKMSFGVSIEKVDLDVGTSGVWTGSVDFIVFREK